MDLAVGILHPQKRPWMCAILIRDCGSIRVWGLFCMANSTIDSRYLLSRELKVSFSARMVDEANAAEVSCFTVQSWAVELPVRPLKCSTSFLRMSRKESSLSRLFPDDGTAGAVVPAEMNFQELWWIEEACKTPSASLVSTTEAINSQTHCRVCAAFMEKKQSCEAKNEKYVATMNSCGQKLCNPH